MRVLLDANLPYSATGALGSAHDVQHVRDLSLAHAPDDKIARAAKKLKAILVTRDLGFGNPHLFPAGSHYGLLILRLPFRYTAEQINYALKKFAKETSFDELSGKITIIEPSRFRRRTL